MTELTAEPLHPVRRGPSPAAARRPALLFATGFALVMGMLSATARPEEDALAALTTRGVAEPTATLLLHLAPVLATFLVLTVSGPATVRLRPLARGLVLGVAGGVCGLVLSLCLEVFAATGASLERLTGPLGEPSWAEVAGWMLAVGAVVLGFGLALARAFGRPALEAMALRPLSEDAASTTRLERINQGRAGMGMALLGGSVAALTLLHQAEAAPLEMRATLALVFLVLTGRSWWVSWLIYRDMDELMRLACIKGYALSGVVAGLGVSLWAGLAALFGSGGFGGFEAFVSFTLVQMLGTWTVAARSMSSDCLEEGA